MDFGRVLGEITSFLDEAGLPWAVVGGVALAAYGLARTTLDLDLVVPAAAQERIVRFMEEQGYETLHRSSGYSNHLHRDRSKGRVDFVYVEDETQERLFSQARRLPGPRGMQVAVPNPEHLVAMKVQAMTSDSARAFQEMADIRHLMLVPGVDRGAVREIFDRFGLAEKYRELEASL